MPRTITYCQILEFSGLDIYLDVPFEKTETDDSGLNLSSDS